MLVNCPRLGLVTGFVHLALAPVELLDRVICRGLMILVRMKDDVARRSAKPTLFQVEGKLSLRSYLSGL
jgi:hypothetical protein